MTSVQAHLGPWKAALERSRKLLADQSHSPMDVEILRRLEAAAAVADEFELQAKAPAEDFALDANHYRLSAGRAERAGIRRDVLLNATAACIVTNLISGSISVPRTGYAEELTTLAMRAASSNVDAVPPGLIPERINGQAPADSSPTPFSDDEVSRFYQMHVVKVLEGMDDRNGHRGTTFRDLIPSKQGALAADWNRAWTQADVACFTLWLLDSSGYTVHGLLRTLLIESQRYMSERGFAALVTGKKYRRLHFLASFSPMLCQILDYKDERWQMPVGEFDGLKLSGNGVWDSNDGVNYYRTGLKKKHIHLAVWISRMSKLGLGKLELNDMQSNPELTLPESLRSDIVPGEVPTVNMALKVIESRKRGRRDQSRHQRFASVDDNSLDFDSGSATTLAMRPRMIPLDMVIAPTDPATSQLPYWIGSARLTVIDDAAGFEPLWTHLTVIAIKDDRWSVLEVDAIDIDDHGVADLALENDNGRGWTIDEIRRGYKSGVWCWRKTDSGLFITIALDLDAN